MLFKLTRFIHRGSLVFIGIGLSLFSYAQYTNVKAKDWQIGFGQTYLFDDYLSPLSHNGGSIRYSSGLLKPQKWGLAEGQDASFNESRWFSQSALTFHATYGQSSANSSLLYGYLDFRDHLFRQFISTEKWKVSIGAYGAIGFGGRYCMQNGNNPGDLDASADLGTSLSAAYHLNLWDKPIKLRYQGSLALVGIAFSPEYAESFYEIFYLNNFRNTAIFTTLANRQSWRQQFCIDIPLSGRMSSVRLSYWNEGQISLMNNIRIRVLSNQFSLGYIRYFSIL